MLTVLQALASLLFFTSAAAILTTVLAYIHWRDRLAGISVLVALGSMLALIILGLWVGVYGAQL